MDGEPQFSERSTAPRASLEAWAANWQPRPTGRSRDVQQPANAVMSFLVAKGVPPNKLEIAGYNFENPIADNTNERGRAMNRRVEIILVEE